MTPIKYNFHDSVLISLEYNSEGFVLVVQLYEIYYPKKQKVKLRFSGVFNSNKTAKLSQLLNDESLEINWIGSRINSIKLDEKKTSKDFDLYFFLDIDGVEPVRIHCTKIEIIDIEANN